MIALYEAVNELSEFMDARAWEYCLIGGVAVQHWGEPRTTRDADFTLLVGWGNEPAYIDELLAHFDSRVENGAAFAMQNRVVLIRASNGVDVDIALGALDFEESMVQRAQPITFAPDLKVPCCTAEDLLVMKLFASRPRDWSDAEGIVARQNGLDREYVLRQLTPLCELRETPEVVERAKRLLGVDK